MIRKCTDHGGSLFSRGGMRCPQEDGRRMCAPERRGSRPQAGANIWHDHGPVASIVRLASPGERDAYCPGVHGELWETGV